jgi:hypothetical protein
MRGDYRLGARCDKSSCEESPPQFGPNMTAPEEGSFDADVLETIQTAGQRVLRQHSHVRDLADLKRSKPTSFQVS